MKEIKPITNKGASDKFNGDVYATVIIDGSAPSCLHTWNVHFAPGARTAWHSHKYGQYLHIVEGTALIQERGGQVQEFHAGQTAYTAPGIEHWHGASDDSFMVHLAIWQGDEDGGATTWKEHVANSSS
ncbi:MAG: cupin domain-containing protein [Micrococcaceae bacterium]